MSTNRNALQLAVVVVLGASACTPGRDTVAPGYYGPTEAGMMGGAPPSSQGGAMPSATGGGMGGPAASGGTGGPVATGGVGGPAATGGTEPGGGSGEPSGMGGQDAPEPGPDSGGAVMEPGEGPVSACDLSGRWLSTNHLANDALGMLVFAHSWSYLEIEQTGDAFTITKGLRCGDESVSEGLFASNSDFSGANAGLAGRGSYTGRTGQSAEVAGGCEVSLETWYVVRGATSPHYLDPAIALPTAADQATDTTPGWEDWDGDGNPGITGQVTGVVVGEIYVAPRDWTSMTGTVPDVSTRFKLPVDWNQEPNVMAYDGTDLLGSTAAKAVDPSLHFAEFARLAADQATGADDVAICASIVDLAPTLTPEASGM